MKIITFSYNTTELTNALIDSINLFSKGNEVIVFDNSDKVKYVNDTVKVLDNTDGHIVNYANIIETHQKSKLSSYGKLNGFGSMKHSLAIQKCMDMFDDNFIIIDSDVLLKKDITSICDENYAFVGEIWNAYGEFKTRVFPHLLYINNKMCKKNGINFFDIKRIVGFNAGSINDFYDTGASFLEDVISSGLPFKQIKTNDYIVHFQSGSWVNNISKQTSKNYKEWLEKHKNLYLGGDESKIDIYICTHKNFENKLTNPAYKVINCNDINNDSWNGLSGSFYSEIMTYFYVAENLELKDYIGFCCYRKQWSFMNDVKYAEEKIDSYGIIVAKPLKFGITVKEQYAKYHNIEDLYIISGILAEKFPDYVKTWNSFINGNVMIPYNMFIMKKNEFLSYINFIKVILDTYVEVIGKDIEKRVECNKDKYLKNYNPNDKIWYQSRIGGYLAERLTNAWVFKNHNKIFTDNIIITEEKYK